MHRNLFLLPLLAIAFFFLSSFTFVDDDQQQRNFVLETDHYVFYYNGKTKSYQKVEEFSLTQEEGIKFYLQAVERTLNRKIEFHLYESPEDKGLLTGNTNLSHTDVKKWQVHAIFNEDLRGEDFFAEAKLLNNHFFGESKLNVFTDGLAIYFSKKWGKRGYKYWAKLLYDSSQILSLKDLLSNEIYRKESYLFVRPLAGSLVDFLIKEYGWDNFIQIYKSKVNSIEIKKLEKGWLAHLKNLPVKIDGAVNDKLANHPVFQKGFCYAHEGYQIHNGYLSRKSAESLTRLSSLGTDWISITPFGYLKNRHAPDYFRYSFGAGSENDESVLTAFFAAKKLGMKAMLKPHLLMYSWNFGWPGEIVMKSETDWQQFFRSYSSWIRHYALLAEMYEIDMFCIGVELLQTTKEHQTEWRNIISDIRKIYRGPLVYAANWWQEFEQIEFWDDLDYIGLNCYYPLADTDSASVADLKLGAQEFLPNIEKIARKFQKPVVLTEIGFTSTARNWKNPHERRRHSQPFFTDQMKCYEAIFESFWDKEWFYGFYWWKWPTYLEYGGLGHSGFSPNGKPAEQTVKRWYSKSQNRNRIDF